MDRIDITIVNFAHPITEAQLARVLELTGASSARVLDAPANFDEEAPFADQTMALIEQVGLSAEEWQTLPLLVNLPSFGPIAATVVAALHGLIGHFPAVIRLRRVPGLIAVQFEIAEILNLNQVRSTMRQFRAGEHHET